MQRKSKISWKIKALFFTGAITAASLRGCTYGPPPVDHFMKTQENITQNIDNTLIDSQLSSLNENFKSIYKVEKKSEQSKIIL